MLLLDTKTTIGAQICMVLLVRQLLRGLGAANSISPLTLQQKQTKLRITSFAYWGRGAFSWKQDVQRRLSTPSRRDTRHYLLFSMAEAVESGKEDGLLPVVSSPSSVESSVVAIEVAERQEREPAGIKEEIQLVEVRKEKACNAISSQKRGLAFLADPLLLLHGDDCCPEVTGIFLACNFLGILYLTRTRNS